MTALSAACLNGCGAPKKAYVSEDAAKRDMKHSPKWRRRGTWPAPYQCPSCRAWHLAHPQADL